MGYTHYFTNKRKFTDKQWSAVLRDCKKLNKYLISYSTALGKVVVIDGEGESKYPIFRDGCIHFNGVGENSLETFMVLNAPTELEFCKTARKPYDLMVTACLIVLAKHGDEFHFTSDGELNDWKEGMEFVFQTLGKKYENVNDLVKFNLENHKG